MKTIGTFSKPEDAHLLRMRLEAAGIAAYLENENTVQMNWLYSNAVGGVRVVVADEDVENVKEFLANDAPQECPDAVDVCCPKCGSKQCAPDDPRMPYVSILLVGFPVGMNSPKWKCEVCGLEFTPERSNADEEAGGDE